MVGICKALAWMDRQKEAVVKLILGTLSNIAVIGFGQAIYESRPPALIEGILAVALAAGLVWSAER